jgi:hypothetical protein
MRLFPKSVLLAMRFTVHVSFIARGPDGLVHRPFGEDEVYLATFKFPTTIAKLDQEAAPR